MDRKVKQANKYGNNDKHFWGSRARRKSFSGSREHELKTFVGTRGFINGEQGIKSKNIKGSWEHVLPLVGAQKSDLFRHILTNYLK